MLNSVVIHESPYLSPAFNPPEIKESSAYANLDVGPGIRDVEMEPSTVVLAPECLLRSPEAIHLILAHLPRKHEDKALN
ncbi:glycoside hydrolase family 18 protein [Moniliophthora roreri]|nr:glycoside hydrolase family 18 protein [Moniliophthora roreri]